MSKGFAIFSSRKELQVLSNSGREIIWLWLGIRVRRSRIFFLADHSVRLRLLQKISVFKFSIKLATDVFNMHVLGS